MKTGLWCVRLAVAGAGLLGCAEDAGPPSFPAEVPWYTVTLLPMEARNRGLSNGSFFSFSFDLSSPEKVLEQDEQGTRERYPGKPYGQLVWAQFPVTSVTRTACAPESIAAHTRVFDAQRAPFQRAAIRRVRLYVEMVRPASTFRASPPCVAVRTEKEWRWKLEAPTIVEDHVITTKYGPRTRMYAEFLVDEWGVDQVAVTGGEADVVTGFAYEALPR